MKNQNYIGFRVFTTNNVYLEFARLCGITPLRELPGDHVAGLPVRQMELKNIIFRRYYPTELGSDTLFGSFVTANLIVFSLGYDEPRHKKTDMYDLSNSSSIDAAIDTFAPMLGNLPNKDAPLVLIGINFIGKPRMNTLIDEKLITLTALAKNAKYLVYNTNSTTEESYKFFIEIFKTSQSFFAKFKSGKYDFSEKPFENSLTIARDSTLPDLEKYVNEGRFDSDFRNPIGHTVAEYVALGKNVEENRKKLDFLVKIGKVPIRETILPICYELVVLPTTVFRVLKSLSAQKLKITHGPLIKYLNKFRSFGNLDQEVANLSEEIDFSKFGAKFQSDLLINNALKHKNFATFGALAKNPTIQFTWRKYNCRYISGLNAAINFKKHADFPVTKECVPYLLDRSASFFLQIPHKCFGVPPLSHLCIDALLICPEKHKILLNLPPELEKHLEEDEHCYFEWVHRLPIAHRQKAYHILDDLRASNISFNCGSHIKIGQVHGYKGRKKDGGTKIEVTGKFILTLLAPTDFYVEMDEIGYLCINCGISERDQNRSKKEAFYTYKGTQMDSFVSRQFIKYLCEPQIGLERSEYALFLILVYNWVRYGDTLEAIASPPRLALEYNKDENITWLQNAICTV